MTNTRLIRNALIPIINLTAAVVANYQFCRTFAERPCDIPRPGETRVMFYEGHCIAEYIAPEEQRMVIKAFSPSQKYQVGYYVAFEPQSGEYRIPFKIQVGGPPFVPDHQFGDQLQLIKLEVDANAPAPALYQELLAQTHNKRAIPGRHRIANRFEEQQFSPPEVIEEYEKRWEAGNPGEYVSGVVQHYMTLITKYIYSHLVQGT